VVINEIMLAPGVLLADTEGEWIELFNTTQGTIVNLAGYTIALDTGAQHLITPGPAGLKLYPGAYLVLAREGQNALNGGFTPAYTYGDDLPLSDVFSLEGGALVSSLTLRNPSGGTVDQAVIDPTEVLEGRSLELANPYADNTLLGSWLPAGGNPNPLLNYSYGHLGLWGSPGQPNQSSEAPLLHPGCVPPIGSHPCSQGRCTMSQKCVFPLAADCCTSNIDCNDFENCTFDACNLAVQTCLDPVWDPQCCASHSQCDDGNPCNLDRCINTKCRYSNNLIPQCCTSELDCDDGDWCTIDPCDLGLNTCEPGLPVPVPQGEQCCNAPGDCQDNNPATLDQCLPATHLCRHVLDPEYCDDPLDVCDDGAICTTDSCNTSLQKCQHIPVGAGCCDPHSDCADPNPCTLDFCDFSTGACQHIPKQGCCTSNSQCDDAKPCTENLCSQSQVCQFLPIAGCCGANPDCNDGAPCTSDTCKNGKCEFLPSSACCTAGASQTQWINQCGPDPDGAASCKQWSCTALGVCALLTNPVCCTVPADCDDGNACTNDSCVGNSCKHLPKSLEGTCCVSHTECPDLDGNNCTVPYCAGGFCVNLEPAGCAPDISAPTVLGCDGALGAGGGDAPAGSCWRIDYADYLGPDAHCECFGFAGSIGSSSVLKLQAFDPGTNDQLTYSARLSWRSAASSGSPGGGMDDGNTTCTQLPVPGNLLLQEILADPQSANDANQDGVSNPFDQFLEAVNTSGQELNLSGVALQLNAGTLYTLPAGTCIYPGQGLVLFGSVPVGGSYTGALAFAAGAPLGLPATGATVSIRSASGVLLQQVTYGAEAGNGQSIARPDLDPLGTWVKHSLAPYASGATHSAGTCQNRNRLPYCPPITPGVHTLYVVASAVPGDFSAAEVLTTVSIDTAAELPSKITHAELSTFLLTQQAVYIGVYLQSADPPHLDFALDDVFVSTGHAPFFVTEPNFSMTYQAGTANELTDAGTLTVALGESKPRLLWAHDAEWASQPLNFSLIGAPSFVSVANVEQLWLYGVYQATLEVAVPMTEVPGLYSFIVRVDDGVFYQEVPMAVAVELGGGYLLWDPMGGSSQGNAIAAALEANGVTYHRVSNLATVGTWNQVAGVFATLGGGTAKHVLSQSEAGPLVGFMDQGGHVYLEGSATFAEDPATSLLPRFRMVTTAVDAGLAAGLEGRFFLYDDVYAYTTDPGLRADVDGVAASLLAPAAKVVLRGSGGSGPGVAVAYDDPSTGSRTVGSTVLLSALAAGTNNAADLVGGVLYFFEHGFGKCASHTQCDDSLACTLDQCVGELCEVIDCETCLETPNCAWEAACTTNAACVGCLADTDCPPGLICQATGTCVLPPPGPGAGPEPPTSFGCDSTDARVVRTLTSFGFGTIQDALVSVHLTAGQAQNLGPVRLTLSHNGVTVVLKEAGPPDGMTSLAVTYDAGALLASGSMQDFNGTFVQGPWVLVVEDTAATVGCHTLESWRVWLVTSPEVSCTTAANCDNQQFCDGQEVCNGLGSCSLGSTPACADGNPCSADLCDPLRNGAKGACDNTRRAPSCAPAACSGSHAMDAGDELCGLTEACVGGLSAGVGTCTAVCPGCLAKYGEGLDLAVPDAGCVNLHFDIQATQTYTNLLNLQLQVAHPDLGQLTARLYAPSGASVLVMGGQGAGLVDMASTFRRSNPNTAEKLCALYGQAPDGIWTVKLCDATLGQQGVLETASLWVGTTNTDPSLGDHCTNAVPVPIDLGPQSLSGQTECRSDSTQGGCGGAGGLDAVYSFSIPGPDSMRLVSGLTPVGNWDAVFYVTSACLPGSVACSNLPGVGVGESLDAILTPGTWYLVVDGVDASAWGAFNLAVAFYGLVPDGTVCTVDYECASSHCQNGFCCASGDCCVAVGNCPASYGGAAVCDNVPTCQGHLPTPTCSAAYQCGTANVPNDSGCTVSLEASNCGLYPSVYCNGAALQSTPACPTSCISSANCDPGAWCNAGLCVPTEPNGSPCAATQECQSGLCVDGVCCNAVCGGTCASCAIAGSLGTCTPYTAFTDPANECFGIGTCGGVCNGAGACSFTAATVGCALCTTCDGAGSCAVPTAAGTDPLNDCGLCQACNGAGACQNVAAGTDPIGECSVDPVTTCGKDGNCSGAGACTLYPNGTVCVAQSCAAGTVQLADTCSGAGVCVDNGSQSCEGALCSGSACSVGCITNADCLAGYTCHPDGVCRLTPPIGMFSNITTSAGIVTSSIWHGSIAWGDYNLDGYPDLHLSNGQKLYRNNGNATFTNVAPASMKDKAHWADLDNDGDLDLSNGYTSSFHIWRNDAGVITTELANLNPTNAGCHGWFDYDKDGDLDAWLVQSVLNDTHRLYLNNGNLSFTSMVPPSVGELTTATGNDQAWNLLLADYDADADTDVVVRLAGTARIIRNNGDGSFTEVASHGSQDDQGVNGGGFADYDRDGDLDLFLASQEGPNRLLRNSGNGPGSSFVDVASSAGVAGPWAAPWKDTNSRGVAWGDYNHDGELDLFVSHIYGTGLKNHLYWNRGDGTFLDVAESYGMSVHNNDGSAMWVDFDLDGDLDLYVSGDPGRLYQNNLNDSHHLKVKVQGRGRPGDSPADGTGSRVELYTADGLTLLQTRELFGTDGLCSSGPGLVHFGLRKFGGGSGTYQVKVKFTSGKVATRTGVVPVNESITIGPTTLVQTILVKEPPLNLDHMRVSHTDGEAATGQTEVLMLLSEDVTGGPTETALPVTVTVGGSATFSATNLAGVVTGLGTNTLTGMLSAQGTASVTLTDSVQEVVTVAADATGDQELLPNLPSKVAFRPAATMLSFSSTVDATIRGNSPTTWYGGSTSLDIDSPTPVRFLIKFPSVFGVGQVPLGSVIDSATLSLDVFNTGGGPYVREVREAWDGGTVTWNNRSTGVAWTSPGAGEYPSIEPWTLGSFPSATTGLKSMVVTTSVQRWSNQMAFNEGWAFVPSASSGTGFYSSEYGVVASRPQLTVGYLPPDRDHMLATAADGRALPGTTETVTLQLAHLRGAPVAGGLPVTVTVTGSAWFVSNNIGAAASGPGVQTLAGTLAASGSGSVTIQSNALETVAVSANATGDAEVKPNLAATVEFTDVVVRDFRQGDVNVPASDCVDTEIGSGFPAVNYGSTLGVELDTDGPGFRRILLQFPRLFTGPGPAVPITDVILSATLNVVVYNYVDLPISFFQLTESWVEMEATWTNRTTASAWTGAGASAGSREAVACAQIDLDAMGPKSADVTSCLQSWQAGTPNYGWVVQEPATTNGSGFYSSEQGDLGLRPSLSILTSAPTADHVVVTATDGYAALAEEEVLSLQLSHRLGAPVPGALPVTVTVVGPGAITATSPVGTLTAAGSGTVTVRCDAPGWVTVTANATGDAEQAPNLSAKLGCRAFRDVTAAAGLGGAGNYAVAWGDYNGDAFPDVYVGGVSPAQGKLYKNPGSAPGAFTAIAVTGGSEGAHWADYDNDGDADLVANLNALVNRNDGADVFSLQSHLTLGFTGLTALHDVAWLDYDRDGDLDLFTPNADSNGNTIHRNNGTGSFTRAFPPGLTRSAEEETGNAAVADYDGDGDTDILVRTDDRAILLKNRNDGTFVDGAVFTVSRALQGTGGSAFGDYDNDGDLDLMLGGNGQARLLRNAGGDSFLDVTAAAGLTATAGATTATAWGDFDNDGDLDLYLDVEGASNRLYSNNGNGTFEEVGGLHGVASLSITPKSGAMFADSDLDGDLDLLVAAQGGSVFLQNTTNGIHHLKVKVRGYGPPLSPIDGTGSRIEIWNSVRTSLLAMRELSGGEGYGGHAPRMAHFGLANLGGGTAAYDVRVRFSSGSEVWVDNLVPTAASVVVGPTTVPQTIEVVELAPVADHVTVTAALGAAQVTVGQDVLALQLVTRGGLAFGAASTVTVSLTGSATVFANTIGGANGGQSVTGTLSAAGTGTVTIQDTVKETVGVAADATGDAQVFLNVSASVAFTDYLSYRMGDGKGSISETDDAFIDEYNPTVNSSDASFTWVRGTKDPDVSGLLKFPNIFGSGASQLPYGSTIAKAVLVVQMSNTTPNYPAVYQLLQSWTESQVTWNQRYTSVPWADPGGDGPTSHKPVLEGYLPAEPSGARSVVVTQSVQGWSNSEPNQGWLLVSSGTDSWQFNSSEHGTLGNRPELRVYYIAP
jgi:subtilisin-like proprotein convertase family protein